MINLHELRLDFPGFSLGPVSLHVEPGAFFALMGPTGSGKTLLLEMIAGLLKPHKGRIELHGKDVTNEPPEQRGIGLVYQDNALFPHMSVLKNITYGQRYHGIAPSQGERHALELAEMLGLTRLLDRKPAHLSGGEKQRVALARALACKPGIVLLDEPLSSLDPQFREGLRKNLKLLHAATKALFFMVTHDFVDALTLADQSAVIHKGVVEQVAPTSDIFHKPATTFIADFVGMENIFSASYANGCCQSAAIEIPCDNMTPAQSEGHLALRPEDVHICTHGVQEGWVSLQGDVEAITRQGFNWAAVVRCEAMCFTARLEHRLALNGEIKEGSRVTLAFDPQTAHHIF